MARFFHVQTEDRGINSATLDTTVHCRGRVLHRRTNKYHDLLPLDAEKEKTLKTRLDEQHFGVVEELKSGALKVEAPQAPPPRTSASCAGSASSSVSVPSPALRQSAPANSAKVLTVEMLNPRTWLSGKHATLYLVVRSKDGGTPAAAARVVATVAGAAEPTAVETEVQRRWPRKARIRHAAARGRRCCAGDRSFDARRTRATAFCFARKTQSPSRKLDCGECEKMESTIQVNGETRPAIAGGTVIDLLRELGLEDGRVAIERNLEILPRQKWSETKVVAGDRYEIVHFVGGG